MIKEVESSVLHGLYVGKHISTGIIFVFGGWARSSLLCGFFLSCSAQASHCGLQASVLHSTWGLPRSRIEPVSPALAGGFFTTEPPGKPLKETVLGTSLVIQWIRIFLPVQETWVRYLVGKDSTCPGVTKQLLKPVYLKPALCSRRSHCNEKPVYCSEEWLLPPLLGKALV